MTRMRDSSGDDWLTVGEAALAVRRSKRTVQRWLNSGLASQTVRGVRYIRGDDLFSRLRAILLAEPEVKTRHEAKSDVAPRE